MKYSIWKLFIITAMAMILGVAPAVNADEVTGYIYGIYVSASKIEIFDPSYDSADNIVTIFGFPFNNLEAQLEEVFGEDFDIKLNDCLTVHYTEKTMPSTGETFYKWESLLMYINESDQCRGCPIVENKYVCECDTIGDCDDGDKIIEPFITRNRAKPGDGQQGHGQGQKHGKPPVTVPGHNKR